MSDAPTDDEAAWLRDVHALAATHNRRAVLLVTVDVLTGQTSVSSPIDDPRDVQELAEHVLAMVRRDVSRVVAVGPNCTHGGKA